MKRIVTVKRNFKLLLLFNSLFFSLFAVRFILTTIYLLPSSNHIISMKKFTVIFSLIFSSFSGIYSQNLIDVTDQTIKIGSMKEEKLLFGFAEGDQIIFNFQEVDGKELKEIEILEYPDYSRFADFKTNRIDNKNISVAKQGVYVFRFKNSAVSGRICKIKIQRIPLSDKTVNFNSAIKWETKQETTYNTYVKDVLVGYDTTYIQKSKKELVKTEFSDDMIVDKTERVHSLNNLDYKNYKTVRVPLPQNEYSTYKTKTIVAWAYWVGVGKEASESWTRNVKVLGGVASTVAGILISPLAKYAVGIATNLATPSMGEDVAYWFIPDYRNEQLFMTNQSFTQFDMGKGVAAFGKNSSRTQGEFYIGLLNDNQIIGIDVNVKITVIWETKFYEDKNYTEMVVKPRYEKKQFSDPIITTTTVPVTGN